MPNGNKYYMDSRQKPVRKGSEEALSPLETLLSGKQGHCLWTTIRGYSSRPQSLSQARRNPRREKRPPVHT